MGWTHSDEQDLGETFDHHLILGQFRSRRARGVKRTRKGRAPLGWTRIRNIIQRYHRSCCPQVLHGGFTVPDSRPTIAILGASDDRSSMATRQSVPFATRDGRYFPIHPTLTEVEGHSDLSRSECSPRRAPRPRELLTFRPGSASSSSTPWPENPPPRSGSTPVPITDLLARAEALGLKVIQACGILDIGQQPWKILSRSVCSSDNSPTWPRRSFAPAAGAGVRRNSKLASSSLASLLPPFFARIPMCFGKPSPQLGLAVDLEALAVGAGQAFVAVPSLGDPHPVPLQSRVLLVEVMEVRLCVASRSGCRKPDRMEPAASHEASATPHPTGVGPLGGFLP